VENKPPLYYVFAVLAGVGAVCLLVVAKESVEAIRDRMLGDETPQTLTASDLLANGAGANRHVTLIEIAVGADYLMRTGPGETENETYLVVSPAGVAPGTSGKSLIVHVTRFQDYSTAQSNPQQRTFTGFFTASGELPPAQKQLLAERYPSLALDRLPYLEVRDYKGTSGLRRALYFGVAAVPLLVVGIAGMVILGRSNQQPPTRGGPNRTELVGG
jgi:hypothetical protein